MQYTCHISLVNYIGIFTCSALTNSCLTSDLRFVPCSGNRGMFSGWMSKNRVMDNRLAMMKYSAMCHNGKVTKIAVLIFLVRLPTVPAAVYMSTYPCVNLCESHIRYSSKFVNSSTHITAEFLAYLFASAKFFYF